MMADSNGWTDEREEEREALDQLDMTLITAPVPRKAAAGAPRAAPPCRGARDPRALRMNRKGSGAGSPIVYVRSPMRRASRRKAIGGARHQPHPPCGHTYWMEGGSRRTHGIRQQDSPARRGAPGESEPG
jgi:hypothetical protein